ncbi:endonuclease-reverse transcriptase [Lasius niger]|uniref:Endonuclease-reverse transcriptase n=1 Tax=Lasius niger TaxID=67767 RepID=A0A0J7K636_LASNI|nr:endonuclease-reverse transcriptase [Lasius niger]
MELLKYGGRQLVTSLHELMLKIWDEERMPEEWRTRVIYPIHKKGDKFMCKNYREISLLSTAYQIFTTIIKDKIEENAESIIGEYQAGFRPGRSTVDQLFTERQVYKKFWEFNIDIYQLFIDFKQAYNSIDRNKLFATMLDFKIHPKLVRLVRCTMQNTRSQVKIAAELTSVIEVSQKLKQEDGLAPTLFNLALEHNPYG